MNRELADSYDYVVIGSGFGGSVSALRLAEKGYSVLVVEKGNWYNEAALPGSTWKLKKWLWQPQVGLRGIMKLTTFRHVTVMSGVGVGGGSLVYGATLPTPKPQFFESGTWAGLGDWQQTLKPHYDTALRMLGATTNATHKPADEVMKTLAREMGQPESFGPSRVGIYFGKEGEAGQLTDDPYFDGDGPARRGCIECGECMTGCRHNAKNSLDKNYLYLAQKRGAQIVAETEVTDLLPAGAGDGSQGYLVTMQTGRWPWRRQKRTIAAGAVVIAGGVTGTVPLMLDLKARGHLPQLSEKLGHDIRTNNEALASVTALDAEGVDYTQGICIGSIVNIDVHSHLEPIHYGKSSATWRLLMWPYVSGRTLFERLSNLGKELLRKPGKNLKVLFARNWGKQTIYLLFMQHLDSTLQMRSNRFGMVATHVAPESRGDAPSCHMPVVDDIVQRVENIMDGKAARSSIEVALGAPTTAHVLGGAVMGENATQGVVDSQGKVFNYDNLYVCDGSMISANPGVNPSLSITAISEHIMACIPAKSSGAVEGENVRLIASA
jgi:cholesterol oxidase